MWSECINLCCLHGQHVSVYIAHVVSMFQHMLPTWSSASPCNAHVVRVSHHMGPTWSCASQCNAHVVRVSHHMMPMLSYVSPYDAPLSCVSPYVSPCVSPCVVSIHAVHMVRMHHHMPYQFVLFTWSECITICRINSYCSHGWNGSPHNAHVVIVYPA